MKSNYYVNTISEINFPKTTTEKVITNIKIIKLVKELEASGQQATRAQQELLATYVGWGGLANEFFDEYNQRFEKERNTLKEVVTEKEYKALKRSSLTAYYTDPAIALEMWNKLLRDGFKGGNILDPSMGTGIFFMTMPEILRASVNLYGIELDSITGAIAKQLFPLAKILVQGFETVEFSSSCFDLVMTNVPFANLRIIDESYSKPYLIHDYFIKKSLDLVRDNGVVAVISSTGTMDKRSDNILQDIKAYTRFLGGVRLPRTAFKNIAGTDVTTDILFFEKHPNVSLVDHFENAFEGSAALSSDSRIVVNPYFQSRIQDGVETNTQILGTYKIENYNGGTLTVVPGKDDDLYQVIARGLENTYAFSYVDRDMEFIHLKDNRAENKDIPNEVIDSLRLYEFGLDYLGNVYYRDRNGIRRSAVIEEISFYQTAEGDFVAWAEKSQNKIQKFEELFSADKHILVDTYINDKPSMRGKYVGCYKGTYFYESPLDEKSNTRIRGMIAIKNAYQSVIDIQINEDYEMAAYQTLLFELNSVYDNFVKKYGPINNSINTNLFNIDDRYSLIASLEEEVLDENDSSKVKYVKGESFTKPLVRPKKVIKEVTSARDALNTALSEGRGVDFTMMTSIYPNSTKESILLELGEEVVFDVEKYSLNKELIYITKGQFLSGDVLTKLELVAALIESGDTTAEWEKYKESLENILPERVFLTDISYQIGSHWIPANVLGMFALKTFYGVSNSLDNEDNNTVILDSPDGTRNLTQNFVNLVRFDSDNLRFAVRTADGSIVSRYGGGSNVFSHLLNSQQPSISKTYIDEDGKKKQQTDDVATANLREIENDLQDSFLEFVATNEEVATLVEEAYNQRFNRYVPREYNGDNLTIDGLAKNISLRKHQRDSIQRVIEEKRLLAAHEVGSGKTLTMLGAAFKLKELGLVNKPLFVVPSALTAQFGQEILKFFPTKNVLVTTPKDFEKSRRKLFISRMITGEYDAIVMGDTQFERIPVSAEREEQFINDKLTELESSINYTVENNGERHTIKNLELQMDRLEKRLEEMGNIARDEFIIFEKLGVDLLLVDEAHHFKNIRPQTQLGNVVGIQNKTSQKNYDMEMKVRIIQEENDGKNIIFATGTPISNSISEMFIMMNYIQPDILRDFGVGNFDEWVGTFGSIENSLEINTTGDKYVSRKRFKKFNNLPELMTIYKMTTDIRTSDMLDLDVPTYTTHSVVSQLTPAQESYIAELVKRSDRITGGGTVDPSIDNMLKITSEARKLALDMRLLDEQLYGSEDAQKLSQVVDNVVRIYNKESANKATQMIFSDLGTPTDKNKGFNIYDEIKKLLIEQGILREEIAFVHDANSVNKKLTLSRKVNAGEIRVLIASTEKGGTGLNVQKRMKAVHHLDVPWRPSDIIQRNGRVIRQGNMYSECDIYHYITTGSFDNYLWQIQETKLRYISQIMTSRNPLRTADDIDEMQMSAADFKAIATGNPYLKQKMELENEYDLLRNKFNAWQRSLSRSKLEVSQAKKLLDIAERRLTKIEMDIELADQSKEIDFSMSFNATYTTDNRAAAGNQLFYAMQQSVSPTKEVVTLAQYRGFDLKVTTESTKWNKSKIMTLHIVGNTQYDLQVDFLSPEGLTRRIDNVINSIRKQYDVTIEKIAYYKSIVRRGTISDVFKDEARLTYVTEKLKVISPMLESKEIVSELEIEKALEQFEVEFKTNFPKFSEPKKKEVAVVEFNLEETKFDEMKSAEAAVENSSTFETITPEPATTGNEIDLFSFLEEENQTVAITTVEAASAVIDKFFSQLTLF